jgi:predicted dehydrogenase
LGIVRIGVLGAARVVPMAVTGPAREVEEVEVVAIASRDPERARKFAAQHGVPRVHASYEALIADPEIDAVYNPVPNALHGRWTIAALNAGKHVLSEKPFAANAEEAAAMAAAGRASGRVLMEAFHARYHAVMRRMQEIVGSGELGALRRIEASFCVLVPTNDVRWRYELGGGSLMDTGPYVINFVRALSGAEPVVRSARAKLYRPGIDRFFHAELDLGEGRSAAITTANLAWPPVEAVVRAIGQRATLVATNPFLPHWGHGLAVRSAEGVRRERLPKQPSSYVEQLRAFAGAVLRGEPFPTTAEDAVATMRVIDACYAAAGLPRREPLRD